LFGSKKGEKIWAKRFLRERGKRDKEGIGLSIHRRKKESVGKVGNYTVRTTGNDVM